MYKNKPIFSHPRAIHRMMNKWPLTKKLIFIALMATLASVLQAAGGLLPGIGYLLSPFATAPIMVSTLISFPAGVFNYFVTICLLGMIQPTELIIFPFTTGLLGLGLGWTFRICNQRFGIVLLNSCLLFIGICIPLYGFGFPIFGPGISLAINPLAVLIIFAFSFLYSWLWVVLGLFLVRKVQVILTFN